MKNPGFLQSVICLIAEERFNEEIIDTDSLGSIEVGNIWESKSKWINNIITKWFNDAAIKGKIIQDKEDNKFNIKKLSISIAKSIYNISLGDNIDLDDGTNVTRVPGGWIYVIQFEIPTAVFIPYNVEFKELSIKEYDKLLIDK